MKPNVTFPLLSLLTLAVAFAAPAAQAEDVAIVTGIGTYRNLPDSHLDGIDNDVKDMETALHNAGFHIIRLFNEQADEDGIRGAFAQARQRVRSGDRFIYYQSSHGSRDYHLLTYDTTADGRQHMLSKSNIQSLMARIPTQRKSLILDACFSGGFLKERGGAFRQVKFYNFPKVNDVPQPTIRDRNDTVRRELSPTTDAATGKRDFVLFASSQDNQPSRVDQIDGTICSVFTHFLVKQLNANNHAAWNSVVQPTIAAVLHETDNGQTPVFDSAYLTYLVFTTDQRGGADGNSAPIHNLAQLYDINNVNPDSLALSARLADRDPADGELYHPDTPVQLNLHVGRSGYLFLINRDDEDNAQLIGWGREDLDLSNPEKMLDQSRLDSADDFEFGKGTLKITTSRRSGTEHWKAFLFTGQEDALKFVKLWTDLTTDKNKRVRLNSFANAKLDEVTRIGVSGANGAAALYTSEVHYRVTDQ